MLSKTIHCFVQAAPQSYGSTPQSADPSARRLQRTIIHPVRNPRFGSFRTQPLEILSVGCLRMLVGVLYFLARRLCLPPSATSDLFELGCLHMLVDVCCTFSRDADLCHAVAPRWRLRRARVGMCIHMCVYIYIYIYMRVYIYIYIYIHIHIGIVC